MDQPSDSTAQGETGRDKDPSGWPRSKGQTLLQRTAICLKYTFDSTKPDGSPRRFVGMFRPPYMETFTRPGYGGAGDCGGYGGPLWGNLLCANEEILRQRNAAGYADKPLYEDDE